MTLASELRARYPLGPMVSPDNVANLTAWWDAGNITGLTDGDPVATWPDASGNGFDLTQATAGDRPTWQETGINGLPSVRCPSGTGMTSSASFTATWSCIYVVANVSTTSATRRAIQGVSNNYLLGPYNGFWRAYTGSFRNTRIAPVAEPFIHGISATVSGAFHQFTNLTVYATTTGTVSIGDVAIGVSGAFAESFLGDFGEIVAYDRAITDVEAQSVIRWFMQKYGIFA